MPHCRVRVQQPPKGGSAALPVLKPRSHDLGYPAGRIGCSFRTNATVIAGPERRLR